MASISSMKMMAGARLRASSNRSRTRAAPTPTNSSTKLEPVTEKNGTSASPATARASSVLPVPGGPTISTPRGTSAPTRVYRSGLRRKSTTSAISALAPSYPATSANVVRGRSSSKTLARDRPAPSTPCSPPAAPRDSRRNSQTKISSGSPQDQQPDQHLGAEALARRGRRDRHAVGLQLGEQRLAGLRRDDHGEVGPVGQRAGAGAARRGRSRSSSPCAPTRRTGTGSRSGWRRRVHRRQDQPQEERGDHAISHSQFRHAAAGAAPTWAAWAGHPAAASLAYSWQLLVMPSMPGVRGGVISGQPVRRMRRKLSADGQEAVRAVSTAAPSKRPAFRSRRAWSATSSA